MAWRDGKILFESGAWDHVELFLDTFSYQPTDMSLEISIGHRGYMVLA